LAQFGATLNSCARHGMRYFCLRHFVIFSFNAEYNAKQVFEKYLNFCAINKN
jgi:hypothetical protein